MPLKNADITAALIGGSAVKLSDGHSLYFVTNGGGAGSWVYEYRDAGRLRSKGLGSVADVSVAVARRLREDFRTDRRNGTLRRSPARRLPPYPRPRAAMGPRACTGLASLLPWSLASPSAKPAAPTSVSTPANGRTAVGSIGRL